MVLENISRTLTSLYILILSEEILSDDFQGTQFGMNKETIMFKTSAFRTVEINDVPGKSSGFQSFQVEKNRKNQTILLME